LAIKIITIVNYEGISLDKNNRVLISGAGVAGLTAAYWLNKWGYDPVVIEHAPTLREGGYMIDFWGVGFDVAEKMGILPELEKAHYNITSLDYVDKNNHRKGGIDVSKMRAAVNYRHYNLLRGNLVRVLYDLVKSDVKIIFGNSIQSIDDDAEKVDVRLTDGHTESFDLLIGADGLHSNVRSLEFGEESQYEKYLKYYTSSFTIDNYLNKDNIFRMYSTPGKEISIYSVAENKLAAFLVFRQEEHLNLSHHDIEGGKKILWDVFGDVGWESQEILRRMETASDFYFDVVSQILMDTWHKNRITLIGDAGHCVSLLAGQGSGLAMASAYTLAGELKDAGGDYAIAFRNHQSFLSPEIERTRKIALEFGNEIAPGSNIGIWKRNLTSRLTSFQFVMNSFVNKFMANSIRIKTY
jgi:2-polyprenyl-6-methoxyphenol hydroxylase-like FAD-dependent oxidoreductase